MRARGGGGHVCCREGREYGRRESHEKRCMDEENGGWLRIDFEDAADVLSRNHVWDYNVAE